MWRCRSERTMPTPSALAMIDPADLFDPVSYRYEMLTPWGRFALDLSVDIKILLTESSYVAAIGRQLWYSTIATAISAAVQLDLMWYVRWHAGPLAFPSSSLIPLRGRQSGTPAGRDHCPHIIMHTGHSDNLAARRLVLPSTPAAWQTDTMLNSRGWDSLLTWAQGISMGLAGDTLGGDLQHLIAYPRIIDPSPSNLAGVLFRRVTHLKVLQFTDKAAAFQGGIWP